MWISKDQWETDDVRIWATEPKYFKKEKRYSDNIGYWSFFPKQLIMYFCSYKFEKITGIKLKEGELRKVKITKFKGGFKFELV